MSATRTTGCRLWAVLGIAVGIALGCGYGDEGGAEDVSSRSAETPDVSAPAPQEGASSQTEEAGDSGDAIVQGCLDLVQAAEWDAAVDACLEAVGVRPDDPRVQEALEEAQAGAAKQKAGQAGEAAQEAIGGAMDKMQGSE